MELRHVLPQEVLSLFVGNGAFMGDQTALELDVRLNAPRATSEHGIAIG
jgi:hypothetical protein